MKIFTCPDCKVQADSCEGCQRAADKLPFNIDYTPEQDYLDYLNSWNSKYIPNCCKNCPNHPSNGGSGICTCTLPYFDNSTPWKVSW